MRIEQITTALSQIAKPMLCEKADAEFINLFQDKKYLASKKFDGCRALMIKEDNKIILKGRSGYTYEEKFKEVVEFFNLFPNGTILDGELTCKTFQNCQARCLTKNKYKLEELQSMFPATYYIFDIIAYDFEDLTELSFIERQEKLKDIFGGYKTITDDKMGDCGVSNSVILVENSEKIGEMWEKAKNEKWEGIILKNPNSTYQFKRSNDWLKLKCTKTKLIEFDSYTINNAGVRAVSKDGLVTCQIGGKQNSNKFLEIHKKNGVVNVLVGYLEQIESGALRMPICKGVKE